jgi:predicted DCC family thiol-disulfide oxidoreductase YuxK
MPFIKNRGRGPSVENSAADRFQQSGSIQECAMEYRHSNSQQSSRETKNHWLIYDESCGLCTSLIAWVSRIDQKKTILPLGQAAASIYFPARILPRDFRETLLFISPAMDVYQGSSAVGMVLKQLQLPWSWLGSLVLLPVVQFFAEFLYLKIAQHRGRISQLLGLTACTLSIRE